VEGKQAARSFRELIVWKKSLQLTVKVYRLTQEFPREELYGLSSQMRRSAVSVPSNVAEGQGRLGTSEFRHFLGISRGSNFELQTQLEVAHELGMCDGGKIDDAMSLSHEVGKMIYAMLEKIKD
jgi:four helix bundle protein